MTANAASRSGGGRRASDVATSGANNRRKKIKTGRVGEGNKNETIVAVLCVHEFEFATEELFLFGAVLNTKRRGGGRERALFAPLGMVTVTCSTSSLLGRKSPACTCEDRSLHALLTMGQNQVRTKATII
jgi:hypothetical protein